ncbi:hypothetical protein BRADI_3g59942v3 [Brachypodium distachyon]|uniref:Lipoxygenase domain-containing protein n=1 Tax=Brachypodium distachyon TaxID=15368 RepID=I1IFI4_BRADI|nr:hypothetical protein BRADI_3g59942v3 [Brachypodium distachyon]
MAQPLLSYKSLEVNAINNQNVTDMHLAEKVPYGESNMEIIVWLSEAVAKNAVTVRRIDKVSELRRTFSDINHNVQARLNENAMTNKRVTEIASQLQSIIGMCVIEVLSYHSSDEVYLWQRDTPQWTSDERAKQAFQQFSEKLIRIEGMIMSMNRDTAHCKNWNGPAEFP